MYVFQIPRSNDFNAISKTRHVIVLALCLVLCLWWLLGSQAPSFHALPTNPVLPPLTSQFSFSQQVRLLLLLGLRKETDVDSSLRSPLRTRPREAWAVCQVAFPGPAWVDYTG